MALHNLIICFIIVQCVLFFIMTFHDWVHIPPFTNIRELEKHSSREGRLVTSLIFATIVLIPLLLTVVYREYLPLWARMVMVVDYGLLTLGTLFSWWVPYIFGSSAEHKKHFIEYWNTHTFLPARGDNIVPNTLHVILHVYVWLCFGIAIYLFCTI